MFGSAYTVVFWKYRIVIKYKFFFFDYLQLFEWDKDNVIVTGSSDGIVRVSGNIVELQLNHSRTKTNCII